MGQSLFLKPTCLRVHKRNLLEAWVVIKSHNDHVRLSPFSRALVGWHHQSLLGRGSRHCHGINYTHDGARPGLWRQGTSYFYLAFQIENTRSFQFGAIIRESANNVSAAPGRLEGAELGLVKPVCPIWREHAVRGTGHWIFWDALRRSKVAANEIVVTVAKRSHDNSGSVHASNG